MSRSEVERLRSMIARDLDLFEVIEEVFTFSGSFPMTREIVVRRAHELREELKK